MTRDDVTLIMIETEQHALATRTLEHWLDRIPFPNVLTFSDRIISRDVKNVPIAPITSDRDKADILVKTLWPFVRTSHALIIQWDSVLQDQSRWSDAYLEYDFVGKLNPWRQSSNQLYGNSVSIRSSKLLQALRFPTIHPIMTNAGGNQDNAMDNVYRDALDVKFNIKFAPNAVNDQFNYEEGVVRDSLTSSGIWNIAKFMPRADVDFYIENRPAGMFADYHAARHIIVALAETSRLDAIEYCLEDIKQCTEFSKLVQWLDLDTFTNKSQVLALLEQ